MGSVLFFFSLWEKLCHVIASASHGHCEGRPGLCAVGKVFGYRLFFPPSSLVLCALGDDGAWFSGLFC